MKDIQRLCVLRYREHLTKVYGVGVMKHLHVEPPIAPASVDDWERCETVDARSHKQRCHTTYGHRTTRTFVT